MVGEESEGELSVCRSVVRRIAACIKIYGGEFELRGKSQSRMEGEGGRVKGINRTCAHCKSHAGYLLRPGDVRGECLHTMSVSGLYLKIRHMSVRLLFENQLIFEYFGIIVS